MFNWAMLSVIFLLGQSSWAWIPQNPGEFFNPDHMWVIRIYNAPDHWIHRKTIDDYESHFGAYLSIRAIPPHDGAHCPENHEQVFGTHMIKLRTSGNYTRGTPKASYKIKLEDQNNFLGLKAINLKSMWNDPSMMREALTWELMRKARIPAPRSGFARFCINNRYMGLYALIENVDKPFIAERFGKKSKDGTLYKANYANDDLGGATLSLRAPNLDDVSGKYYFRHPDPEQRTYEPKTNEGTDYDDLALLIARLHTSNLEASMDPLQEVLDVHAVLRWAAVNMLLASWDNYWKTPSNYFLFNRNAPGKTPYFSFIPWDYDNSFGTSYDGTEWAHQSVLSWDRKHRPLVGRLLQVPAYRDLYLKFLRSFMNKYFNPGWIERRSIQIFDQINTSAFLESDSPHGAPHTGRRFSNDQFYRHARNFDEISWWGYKAYGTKHFAIMRHGFVDHELRTLGY